MHNVSMLFNDAPFQQTIMRGNWSGSDSRGISWKLLLQNEIQ